MLTAINMFTMFPEPSDRLNVAAMVIIGYPVLQNLVADTIPHSDEPSPIARYIAGSFMLAALNASHPTVASCLLYRTVL